MDGSATSTPVSAAGSPAADAPAADAPGGTAGGAHTLSRRETRWVLKRCAKRGHVLAHLDDPQLSPRFTASGGSGELVRCLRCSDFASAGSSPTPVIGTSTSPVPLKELPLVLRGGHGRKLALLRVLSVERGTRGLVLLLLAAGIARLASSHVAVADWLGQIVKAAQPLGQQLGWDPRHSPSVTKALHLLGNSGSTFTTLAWLLGAYGVLQIIEGIGLWGGWLWAEYLAAVATSAFVPIEIYELTHHATVFKVLALLVNVVAVGYLVFKGRLFGIRGGHPAYLAEVRDGTLLAEELRALGRPTTELAGHKLV